MLFFNTNIPVLYSNHQPQTLISIIILEAYTIMVYQIKNDIDTEISMNSNTMNTLKKLKERDIKYTNNDEQSKKLLKDLRGYTFEIEMRSSYAISTIDNSDIFKESYLVTNYQSLLSKIAHTISKNKEIVNKKGNNFKCVKPEIILEKLSKIHPYLQLLK